MFYLRTPFLFSLELTPACNNQCPGCGNVFAHQPVALSAGRWGHIIEMLRPHAHALKITGGEPTMHPEFPEIIGRIDNLGIPFTVFTNARWKHPDQIISLLSRTKHLSGLLVSLHGADVPTHEIFSGVNGSFNETCENIRDAVYAGLHVHISTVLNAFNIQQLELIVEFTRSLGTKRVVFNRFLGKSDSPYQPKISDLKQAIRQIEQLRQRYPVRVDGGFGVRYGNCIPQCFAESGSSGCWAGVAYCTIDPWGKLRPCNHSPTIIGSLFDQSLDDLWQGDELQRWRLLTPDACLRCGAYEQCHGGCRALMEQEAICLDPLMMSPLMPNGQAKKIEFYSLAIPSLSCKILPAQQGWVLTRGLSIFPVSDEALPILNFLNGKTTLQDLQANHGQAALNFVGELVRRGFVSLL